MIALGCDHGGFGLKNAIKQYLEENHIEYKDFGCMTEESVNYGPIAAQVARSVAGGQCEKGILCCGTGIGMSIAANKVKGIRGASPPQYLVCLASVVRNHLPQMGHNLGA